MASDIKSENKHGMGSKRVKDTAKIGGCAMDYPINYTTVPAALTGNAWIIGILELLTPMIDPFMFFLPTCVKPVKT